MPKVTDNPGPQPQVTNHPGFNSEIPTSWKLHIMGKLGQVVPLHPHFHSLPTPAPSPGAQAGCGETPGLLPSCPLRLLLRPHLLSLGHGAPGSPPLTAASLWLSLNPLHAPVPPWVGMGVQGRGGRCFRAGISLLPPERGTGQGLACGQVLRPLPLFVATLHVFSTIIPSPTPLTTRRQNQGGAGEQQQDRSRSLLLSLSASLSWLHTHSRPVEEGLCPPQLPPGPPLTSTPRAAH